jgi:hypothetical protein
VYSSASLYHRKASEIMRDSDLYRAAMCALPREDWIAKWGKGNKARGKKVAVTYKGKTVIGELRDTMPHKAKITNGAGIDLNPGFAKAFNVRPPFRLKDVHWDWV